MNERKLLDFIKGNLSPEEESGVLEWIEKSEENRKKFTSIKNLLAVSNLNYEFHGDYAGMRKSAGRITGAKRRRQVSVFLRYAAAVILTAGLTSLVYISRSNSRDNYLANIYHNVTAPPGQNTDIVLADRSEVFLNSGTVLSYPANFSPCNRTLELSGEAFFEVETDRDNPFIVKVGELELVATGTSFNIDAYTCDRDINITLVDGSAEIRDRSGKVMVYLAPGENARYDTESCTITRSSVDTEFYTSWKRGIIKFSNRKLGDIAFDLERWYNVEIIFDDETSKDIRYSGTILRNKPVEQVLEILKLTSHFNYEFRIDDDKKSIITIKR